MGTNKDRKQKKKEADAKLREHLATAALDATLASTAASVTTSAAPRGPNNGGGINNNSDQTSLYFNSRSGNMTNGVSRNQGDSDDDDDTNNANNAVDNERMARLGGEGDEADTKKTQHTKQQGAAASASGQPKRKKLRQEEMKLALERALGPSGIRYLSIVDPHIGNAPDPFVAVQLKANKANVPVPPHWLSVSAYLSNQNDRPDANVIPQDIVDTGVRFIRSRQNEKPDVAAFARAFLNGNPMQVKTHGIRLLEKGKMFKGKRWKPSVTAQPGIISDKLRAALGMLSASSPPPWIHAMQRVGTLPPSYPTGKFPGLNAPIPDNGQWGYSKGQWGEPVRTHDGNFLYPAVQSLGAGGAAAAAASSSFMESLKVPPPYGTLPPRRRAADTTNATSADIPTTIVPAASAPTTTAAPTTVPVAFTPNAANVGLRRPILPVMQMEQYLLDISADADDDLLSAGARLVAQGRAGPAAPAGVSALSLTPNFGI